MNTTLLTLICALCSYLVGAANPAIILSTTIYRKDIRGLGSGNPGFTNFMRVFGKKWAWLVLTIDCSKAIVLCTVFGLLFRSNVGSFQLGAAIAGLFAVLGHCFPVWYGFEGGKGFLAFITAVYFMDWRAGLIATAVLLLVLALSRYMSFASLLAVVTGTVAIVLFGFYSKWVLICCLLAAILVIVRHRDNIMRLVKGTETRFKVGKKEK